MSPPGPDVRTAMGCLNRHDHMLIQMSVVLFKAIVSGGSQIVLIAVGAEHRLKTLL